MKNLKLTLLAVALLGGSTLLGVQAQDNMHKSRPAQASKNSQSMKNKNSGKAQTKKNQQKQNKKRNIVAAPKAS